MAFMQFCAPLQVEQVVVVIQLGGGDILDLEVFWRRWWLEFLGTLLRSVHGNR